MDLAAATLRWERWIVVATVVGTAWVVWPSIDDSFSLPKATVLVVGSLLLLWAAVVRWVWERRVLLPRSALSIAVVAFGVAMVIATLTSTSPLESVVGQYRQYSGLATYLACAVACLATARAFRGVEVVVLLRAFAVGLLGVAGYATLQRLGPDPFGWGDGNQIASSLGNTNFLAGWVAIALAPALVLALHPEEGPLWRGLGFGAAALGSLVVIQTESFQGPVAGSAAAAVALIGVLAVRRPMASRWTRRNVAVAASAIVALAVAGAVILWPTIDRSLDEGLYDRWAFWEASLDVFGDHPLVGTGPDTFHNQFLTRRPIGHVGNNAGAVHDVPLDMLANGGLLVFVPYLSVLLLTGMSLVRAWRRTHDSSMRILVVGVAGAWVGYEVQASVSIDRPALAIAHWVLVGAALALSAGSSWTITLPVRDLARSQRGPAWLAGAAVATVLAVSALFPLTRPLRAGMAVASAEEHRQRGDVAAAVRDVERGRDLAPWEASHTYYAARIHAAAGDRDRSIAEVEAGARLEAGDPSYAVLVAELHASIGQERRSGFWWREAVRRDPWGFSTVVAARAAAEARGDEGETERLTRRLDRIGRGGYEVGF